MRILYASAATIPSRSANSVQTVKMCNAFSLQGHNVTLVCRRGAGLNVLEFYGVGESFEIKRVTWPPPKGGGLVLGCITGCFLRPQRSFDLIYTRNVYSIPSVLRRSFPTVYEAHSPPRKGLHLRLERRLLRSPALKRLVVISHALKEEYLQLFPSLDSDQVLVAPDGADLVTLGTRATAPPSWPGQPDRLQVGYVGHLYAGRGVELIEDLCMQLSDFDFHIVGGTDAAIAAWTTRRLPFNMHFHGFVPHGALLQYYTQFDILLAPYQRKVAVAGNKGDTSRWMSPLKIFEYMATGCPIVASDIPVLREVLHDEENALLASPDDTGDWIRALLRLKESPDLRERIGSRARAAFRRKYTWEARARNVLEGLEA